MIRVMTADELASTTITVDGKLSGDYVDPVETCCKQAISKGKPVLLYLRDVSSIDERGWTLLRDLARRGVGQKPRLFAVCYAVDENHPPHRGGHHSPRCLRPPRSALVT